MSAFIRRLVVLVAVLSVCAATAGAQDAPPDRQASDHAVAGRHRLALRFGAWRLTSDPIGDPGTPFDVGTSDLFVGLQYAHYVREDLAVTIGLEALPSDSGLSLGPGGLALGARTIVAIPVGFEWNPRGAAAATSPIKPYLAAGLGPVVGSGNGFQFGQGGASLEARTHGTIGGHVGGGVDLLLARSWSVGTGLGYNWMAPFSSPIGGRDDYSGVNVEIKLAWLFGGGRGE